MKKIILFTGMALLLISLSGCNKNKQNNADNTNTAAPTAAPTVTLPAAEPTQAQNTQEQEALTVEDYYPLLADVEYVYQGEGNEYAAYNQYTDFLDTAGKRIQTRENNGGTETVLVTEIKDGKVTVIKTVNECYYRDNFLEDAAADENAKILLMEPLTEGTEWTLPDGSRRYISATGVPIETPSGNYQAIEVTTENDDSTSRDYFAPQVGLVKSVFDSGDMQISSTLSKISSNTQFTQTIDIFYPDSDEKIHAKSLELSFKTGDSTRLVLEEALTRKAEEEDYLPLASTNTKINSLYLGTDNIVHVDFSPEFVTEMNAGAGYEVLILQCIANTLGNYYGVNEVAVTVAGKLYESGHILMKEGETLKVNMDEVIR
jgi:hypothetical protein